MCTLAFQCFPERHTWLENRTETGSPKLIKITLGNNAGPSGLFVLFFSHLSSRNGKSRRWCTLTWGLCHIHEWPSLFSTKLSFTPQLNPSMLNSIHTDGAVCDLWSHDHSCRQRLSFWRSAIPSLGDYPLSGTEAGCTLEWLLAPTLPSPALLITSATWKDPKPQLWTADRRKPSKRNRTLLPFPVLTLGTAPGHDLAVL